jgi:hypothetical protein
MRTALMVGLVMATLYSAFAVILYVGVGPAAFARHGTTLLTVILTYYVAGGIVEPRLCCCLSHESRQATLCGCRRRMHRVLLYYSRSTGTSVVVMRTGRICSFFL